MVGYPDGRCGTPLKANPPPPPTRGRSINSVPTRPYRTLKVFGVWGELKNMTYKVSARLLSVLVIPLIALPVACSSESSSYSNEIDSLQSRIEELEAELKVASSSTSLEADEVALSSSTTASEPVTTSTSPATFSRETLAALKDCQWEAYLMVDFLEPNGEVDAFYSQSRYAEAFWTDFARFREACLQAAVAIDLDALEIGASCCDEELVQKLRKFNTSFAAWSFLEMMGETPKGVSVYDWENVREFPQYLSDLLDSLRSR